jgi:hypothetical protein
MVLIQKFHFILIYCVLWFHEPLLYENEKMKKKIEKKIEKKAKIQSDYHPLKAITIY